MNLAYEAATVDLDDVNMIDPFHLEAYGVTTVNYNRDVEIFPVLNAMFQRIYGSSPYKSPTDMGVNMAGYCISDDAVCCAAARQGDPPPLLRHRLRAAARPVRPGRDAAAGGCCSRAGTTLRCRYRCSCWRSTVGYAASGDTPARRREARRAAPRNRNADHPVRHSADRRARAARHRQRPDRTGSGKPVVVLERKAAECLLDTKLPFAVRPRS